ncbi:hypothetical protein FRB90_003391 [Tulasnella sp. 427]|nr:hypothetical protein FRB90_003391 [Tulasnella sp. 427]
MVRREDGDEPGTPGPSSSSFDDLDGLPALPAPSNASHLNESPANETTRTESPAESFDRKEKREISGPEVQLAAADQGSSQSGSLTPSNPRVTIPSSLCHTASGASPLKKQCIRHSAPSSTSSDVSSPLPTVPGPIGRLPGDILLEILQHCFDDAASASERLQILRKFTSLTRRIRGRLDQEKSNSAPLSIHHHPRYVDRRTGEQHQDQKWQHFDKLFRMALPHRERWGTIDVTGSAELLRDLISELESAVPELQAIYLEGTVSRRHQDPELVLDHPLDLLGGVQGCLRHFSIYNIPVQLSPMRLVQLETLGLGKGVRVSLESIVDVLRSSETLRKLCMIQVPWTDDNGLQGFPLITLPRIRQLAIVERSQGTRVMNLFKSIKAPGCEKLWIDIVQPHGNYGPDLLENISSVVKRVLKLQPKTVIRLRKHPFSARISESWEGHEDPTHSFVTLIKQVLAEIEEESVVTLDVGDSLSGIISGALFCDPDDFTTTFTATYFDGLKVVEIAADFVHNHMAALRDLLLLPGAGAAFAVLKVLSLRPISPEEVAAQPASHLEGSMHEFLKVVSETYNDDGVIVMLRAALPFIAPTSIYLTDSEGSANMRIDGSGFTYHAG